MEMAVYHGYMRARQEGYAEKRNRELRRELGVPMKADPNVFAHIARDMALAGLGGGFTGGTSPDGPVAEGLMPPLNGKPS